MSTDTAIDPAEQNQQVLDAIEQSPLSQKTLLLFTADHGEAFGEHESGGHSTTIYEELLRVPLIAWGAGLLPRTIAEPVSLVDLGPTLLDLFGQPNMVLARFGLSRSRLLKCAHRGLRARAEMAQILVRVAELLLQRFKRQSQRADQRLQ